VIYIARHGQTNSNVSHTWMGQSGNDDLNETGKTQAKKLANYFENKNIKKIFSSPLSRALQTANIVAEKNNIEVLEDDLLKEMNYGDLEGHNLDEVLRKFSNLYKLWKSDPEKTSFPNGESFDDLMKRANTILEKYVNNDNILLVSHEDMIRGILTAITKAPKDFWEYSISNTSVTTLRKNKNNEIEIVKIGETNNLQYTLNQ